jgi:hypothetical protein
MSPVCIIFVEQSGYDLSSITGQLKLPYSLLMPRAIAGNA